MNPPVSGIAARGTALLLALLACLLMLRLGDIPFVGPDEPRYARVAVEMLRSHDFVTPTLAGKPWLEKPVLYYWMAAASMAVLGESEAAARLPSAAACLASTLAVVWIGTRLYGKAAGLHAGFVVAMNLLGFIFGRAAAMDMLLASCVTAATGLLGLRLLGRAGPGATVAAYAATALAVLAKGPIGLLLPGSVVGAYVALTRDRDALRRAWSWMGAGVFVAIAAPWYAIMAVTQGHAFLDIFVLNHNVSRFFSTIHQHPGPFYYYIPILLGSLFPWSGLAVAALGRVAPRRALADRFLLLWLLLPLAFFSAAGSKLPGYVLPCVPPLAILVGRLAAACAEDPARYARELRLAAAVTFVIGLLVTITPLMVWHRVVALWELLVPGTACVLVTAGWFALRAPRRPGSALKVARAGAAVFLVILSLVAPVVLNRLESGRDLFAVARGEEVIVWGARRSVWMSGYFYNDGRVREVYTFEQLVAALDSRPRLVLCGPSEQPRLAEPDLAATALADGPRGTRLFRVCRRACESVESPAASAS